MYLLPFPQIEPAPNPFLYRHTHYPLLVFAQGEDITYYLSKDDDY